MKLQLILTHPSSVHDDDNLSFLPPLPPVSGDLVALFVFKVSLFVLWVLTESYGLYIYSELFFMKPFSVKFNVHGYDQGSRGCLTFGRGRHTMLCNTQNKIHSVYIQICNRQHAIDNICKSKNAICNSLSLMCKMQYATPNFNQVHFHDEGSREMRSFQAHLSDPSHTGRCTIMKYATCNKYIRNTNTNTKWVIQITQYAI